jgi:aerobic-type carbon monoxide dehydrogenase small subunit (CoxS/CutS family)
VKKLSRRIFLETTAAGLVAAAAPLDVGAHTAAADQASGGPAAPRTKLRLTVNGRPHEITVEDRCTLAELLRDDLQLTGTKIGCDRGECGACTVLLDGAPIYACSYLSVWVDGRSIETVEGLASGGRLHPLQESFIEHDAPQCGFCTSGQLMSAKALLASNPQPSAGEVRAALTGNLCRCSNYNQYVAAVVAAGQRARPGREELE